MNHHITVLRDLNTPIPRRRSIAGRLGWAVLLAAAFALGAATGAVRADDHEETPRYVPTTRGEVRAVLVEAARRHGADAATVVAVADCESGLRPWVTGDHGTSHGLAQLSDLRGTGLLWHFYAVGYADAYDAEQAADYLAKVAAGHYRAEGVTLARWSCWWVRR